MDFTFEGLQILVFLLPGFITSKVIDSLFVSPQKPQLDKIASALVYSFVSYSTFAIAQNYFKITSPVSASLQPIGGNNILAPVFNYSGFLSLLLISVGWGVLIALSLNNDFHTSIMRKIRATNRTSRSTVWCDVLATERAWLKVNLKDGRKVLGWPKYFSDTPEEGTLFLSHAFWLDINNKKFPISGAGILILGKEGINSIEFWEGKQKEVR